MTLQHKNRSLLTALTLVQLIATGCEDESSSDSAPSHLLRAKEPGLAKLGIHLGDLVAAPDAQATVTFRDLDGLEAVGPEIQDGKILIDATAANGDAGALRVALEGLGLTGASTFGSLVSGWIPVHALEQVAGLAQLRVAHASMAMTNGGLVSTQGDRAVSADVIRTANGLSGSGFSVGVLSDSFSNFRAGTPLTTMAGDIASDDLPADTVILQEGLNAGLDEGRALAQIVHDMAPRASIKFHSATNGMADFAGGILELADAGANVVVDDVSYTSSAFFQPGILAQAVETVVGKGVAYFSSAGNDARKSYESAFRDSGQVLTIGGQWAGALHDFDPGPGVDTYQSVTIQPGSTVTFSFQWDEPYASADPRSPGSSSDLDIFAVTTSGRVITGSASDNLDGDPLEAFSLRNGGTNPATVTIAITLAGGAPPSLMKYIAFGRPTINEFDTQSGTVFGQRNTPGCMAIGASDYRSTPVFGTSPAVVEDYSSRGGVPLLFDQAGQRIAPTVLTKPNFVAPDNVDTTFFYPPALKPTADIDGSGFPNFAGTSAAAPHAAAVGVLLMEILAGRKVMNGESPAMDAEDVALIYEALRLSTKSMGAPGFDHDTGYGLIDAVGASVRVPVLHGKRLVARRQAAARALLPR